MPLDLIVTTEPHSPAGVCTSGSSSSQATSTPTHQSPPHQLAQRSAEPGRDIASARAELEDLNVEIVVHLDDAVVAVRRGR